MGLLVDWGNLGVLALPALVALTTSAILALLLQRLSALTGLPRAREACVDCRFESQLIENGVCTEHCSVNLLPGLPLALFVATGTFAILLFVAPSLVVLYVLPFGLGAPSLPSALVALLFVGNAGASIALAGYFLQDRRRFREAFVRGAIVASLVGLVIGAAGFAPVTDVAAELTPVALAILLVALALELRGRLGRPTLGLRAIGASTTPLFLVAGLALVRIAEVIRLAAQS